MCTGLTVLRRVNLLFVLVVVPAESVVRSITVSTFGEDSLES